MHMLRTISFHMFYVTVDVIQMGKHNQKRQVTMISDLQRVVATCAKLKDMLATVLQYVDNVIVSNITCLAFIIIIKCDCFCPLGMYCNNSENNPFGVYFCDLVDFVYVFHETEWRYPIYSHIGRVFDTIFKAQK